MSKTRSLHHIVFATYERYPAIPSEHKRDLYGYIFGILNRKNCFVHRINGMSDHIHLLIDLNPTVALADLVRDIKRASILWMKGNSNFLPNTKWGAGYYAMSLSVNELKACIEYIKNQESHHLKTSLLDEVHNLAEKNGLTWYEADW